MFELGSYHNSVLVADSGYMNRGCLTHVSTDATTSSNIVNLISVVTTAVVSC